MLRTRAGWNAKESRAFEHVCLEKKRSKYSGQVTEVGLWNVEGACVSPPGPTFLAIHIHQLAVQIVPLSVQISVVMFGKKTVHCPSGLPAILSQIIVIEMFGLARSVKAKGFERSSTCGQRALYHARPGWP